MASEMRMLTEQRICSWKKKAKRQKENISFSSYNNNNNNNNNNDNKNNYVSTKVLPVVIGIIICYDT